MTGLNQSSDVGLVDARLQWADGSKHTSALHALLAEYAQALDVAFCREEVEAELAEIVDRSGSEARFLVAIVGDEAAGCVGIRPIDGERVELERLFVRPAHRRCGLARKLTEAALANATEKGFDEAVLHTLSHWTAACALYRQLGFQPIAPYRDVPEPGVLFFGRSLAASAAQ